MKITLIVLAAGMGSRYGGMKQLDRLGPSGETIMDYSVYDALKAGFNKVVFVIRKSFEQEFRDAIASRVEDKMKVELAFQELEDLPAGFTCPPDRKKPWGTGHALWVCRNLVDEAFAVINADDFYGREAYKTMADYLKSLKPGSSGNYAMCGYQLKNTLSQHGEVSRGICRVDEQGMLVSVDEQLAIAKDQTGRYTSEGQAASLQDDNIVSMNFWGFTKDMFDHLDEMLKGFLNEKIREPKSEFYIPVVVDNLIRDEKARVKVLSSGARWFGVTYKEDKQEAINKIHLKVGDGIYPDKLW